MRVNINYIVCEILYRNYVQGDGVHVIKSRGNLLYIPTSWEERASHEIIEVMAPIHNYRRYICLEEIDFLFHIDERVSIATLGERIVKFYLEEADFEEDALEPEEDETWCWWWAPPNYYAAVA